MRHIFILMLCLLFTLAKGQTSYHIAGLVLDENNRPMPGCHVKTESGFTVTDANGRFIFNQIPASSTSINVTFIGFQPFDTTLIVSGHHHLRIKLSPEDVKLNEVAINGTRLNTAPNLTRQTISGNQLSQQINGTLVKTLDRQAGFNTMDIGASASKPVIRGMGFNRVVVVNNGVKQEGQQWGADHGLEIDPFLSERVEIIRGAASIEHGSDAIGGVLEISSNRVPPSGFSGSWQLLGKSVNETAGSSLLLQQNNGSYFFKGRISVLDYGDYRVPTDNILYLTRRVPIENRRLKNSAGKEQDLFLQGGLVGENWRSSVSTSRVWQKSGFFPGAHGIPDNNRVKDDGNYRNIELPYQSVEHWKATSNTMIQTPHSVITADIGYQLNLRQEWSQFHTHFGNLTPPAVDPDLELEFKLQTLSANAKWNFRLTNQHTLTAGTQWQWQHNRTGGYGFLLPNYDRYTTGIYVRHDFALNRNWHFNAGMRYDIANVETEAFYDPILYNYMLARGVNEETSAFYAQRAMEVSRSFDNISWLAGFRYHSASFWSLSMNFGKSFRVPTASELSANGVHHGSFRHEAGNQHLNPEQSLFADAQLTITADKRKLLISPYIYLFSNYIFLSPTAEWSHLPHTGQIYRYMESKALLGGMEISYNEHLSSHWSIEINGEWIYNRQKPDEHVAAYPLPFSPPANLFTEISYALNPAKKEQSVQLMVNSKAVANQNRISRNEERTAGYILLGARMFIPVTIGKLPASINIQGHNLLNTKYYNHMSFYRKLEIPEPGRNIQVMLNITF